MPWARASALDRHLECPATSWLPRLDRGVWRPGYLADPADFVPPDITPAPEDTSAADWGTAMHLAKADPGSPEANGVMVAMFDDLSPKLWPASLGVHEQAVAYNCRTREVLLGPTNLPVAEMDAWKNAQDDACVVGTADWWASLPLGEPWIDDLKTGFRRPDVPTPQTMFYLLCKCRLEGQDVGRISITWWPRWMETPTREGLWRQIGPLALDGFEDDLQKAWRRAVGPNPEAQPGPWCKYCPSAPDCDRAYD